MHDVPPTTTSIIRGLLFWIPLRNPPGSLLDCRPTIDSQLTGSLSKCAHDSCGRPIHDAVRGDAINHKVVERIRLVEAGKVLEIEYIMTDPNGWVGEWRNKKRWVRLDRFAKEAFAYGADRCYIVRDPVLKGYRNEPFTKGLTDLVNTHQPEIMLLGATTMGRDLAGSVATTLGTGLTADCTELNIDGRALAATRPTFGGSLLCTIMTLAYRPQMATVRPRVMKMPRRDDTRTGSIVEMALGMVEADIVTKLLDFVPDANRNTVNLAYADIIISGGKGLKNADNFKLVWDLARVLGGETDANTRKLKLLNIVVTRLSMMTGADWVGIYQRRAVRGGESLVKLAYRGRASRAEFPLTEAFAQGSTNSRVGLDGMALVIDDVAMHVATGAGFYVCDSAVQSEMCLPIFDETGKTIGIIDAEAEPLAFFNEERQCALVAAAMVVPALLP